MAPMAVTNVPSINITGPAAANIARNTMAAFFILGLNFSNHAEARCKAGINFSNKCIS